MHAKSDICGKWGVCVYILELDRWYCADCLGFIVEILEMFK